MHNAALKSNGGYTQYNKTDQDDDFDCPMKVVEEKKQLYGVNQWWVFVFFYNLTCRLITSDLQGRIKKSHQINPA